MIIVPRVILSSSLLVFKVIVYIAVALHLHWFICCYTWGHFCSLQKWSLSSNRWVGKEISGMWCYLKTMQLLNQLWDSLRVLISERRDASWIIFFSESKWCRAEWPPLPFWLIGVEGSQHISRGALSCRIGSLVENNGDGGEPCKVLLFVT